MSFYCVEQARPRLHRSELAVPGSRPEMFEKAAKSNADVIFLDCEDAVAPDDKISARKNIVKGGWLDNAQLQDTISITDEPVWPVLCVM